MGYWSARADVAPLGYRNSFDQPGGKTAVFDERAPLVLEAFRLAGKRGMTVRRVHRTVSDQGLTGRAGQPVSVSTLHNTLRNPFYIGYLRYKDDLYRGNHEELVSKTLFRKVQANLHRHRCRY